ncbi:MAG: hypothetical protein Q7O66_14950 [Dehalococcoidia bacterium]|nr:hypothetical protein [Dehalococcoidia bacterium]
MEIDLDKITRRCAACGWIGADVHEQRRYIGGKGNVFVLRCDDGVACTKRQDTPDVGFTDAF